MSQARYTYMWEYRVRPEAQAEFRRIYGPEGDWVRLFRLAPSYLGTELLQDRQQPDRYVTIDRWETESAFLEFRQERSRQFEMLDRSGERLTVQEIPLGSFTSLFEPSV